MEKGNGAKGGVKIGDAAIRASRLVTEEMPAYNLPRFKRGGEKIMKVKSLFLWLAALFATACVCLPSPADAQSNPRFIRLAAMVKGVLYLPDQGPTPRIGIMLMHEDSNFLVHIACTEFSKRGYAVLCVNGRSDNNEALDNWNELPLDAALGMKYLREQMKLEKVVLFAHSGGGPLLSFYQAVAEEGPEFCKDARRLIPCTDELKGLPKADGVVFFDPHPGTAVNLLRSLDASVLSEDDPRGVNAALDPYSTANGYNPTGMSRYSDDFKRRYFKAQADRMNKLVATAVERRNLMLAGKYKFPDNDTFFIARTNARLMDLDSSIGMTTEKPRKLIKNDGTVVTQIISSVKKPNLKLQEANRNFGESKQLTVTSFLGTRAIRATDSMDGYDIHSNNNSTEVSVQHIHVPILVMSAGGHYFLRDDEKILDIAASADKDYAVVEGAAHGVVPCRPCETTPGQYANTVKNTFDYMKAWIDKRF
jgi:pimeloyl-ACP methyl ester carboxylesterase